MAENGWWVALMPAIVGFIGVVVGAGITTAANYVLAVRKERAEAVKEKVTRANELRIVARLVWNELYATFVSARVVIEKKTWVHGEVVRNYPLDAWSEGKRVLARELSYDDYQAVEFATRCVDHFRATSTDREKLETLQDKIATLKNEPYITDPAFGNDVTEDTVEDIKNTVQDILAGLDALRPYTQDNPKRRIKAP